MRVVVFHLPWLMTGTNTDFALNSLTLTADQCARTQAEALQMIDLVAAKLLPALHRL